MHLNELKALHVSEVLKQAEELEIENTGRMRKQELMFAIIKKRARTGEQIIADNLAFFNYHAAPPHGCLPVGDRLRIFRVENHVGNLVLKFYGHSLLGKSGGGV